MSDQNRNSGIDLTARSRARRRAAQAIYAWQVGGNPMKDVIEEFRHEQDMEIADLDYFEDLLRGVEKHCVELDAGLGAADHRSVVGRMVGAGDRLPGAGPRVVALVDDLAVGRAGQQHAELALPQPPLRSPVDGAHLVVEGDVGLGDGGHAVCMCGTAGSVPG